VGGVHYLEISGKRVPVAETEYAEDPEFGFSSAFLPDWVAEVGDGRPSTIVDLETVRATGSEAITRALLDAPAGGVVIPDATNAADLAVIRDGLLAAEEVRAVQVRCAASFASMYAGLNSNPVVSIPARQGAESVLLVCGSYTSGATDQIRAVIERYDPPVIEVPFSSTVEGWSESAAEIGRELRESVRDARLVVLMTPRRRQDADDRFDAGSQMMTTIAGAVREVVDHLTAVVAKGGITSAEVATRGLGARRAHVVGQVDNGIPLWTVKMPDEQRMPLVVVPGNMGDRDAINRILGRISTWAGVTKPEDAIPGQARQTAGET
jgi:uncharacterized protein YgbK (DUF1537 family)